MRNIMTTGLSAFGFLGLTLGAAHAHAAPSLFTSPAASMMTETAPLEKDGAHSVLETLLGRELLIEVAAETTATAAADREAAKGECPEAKAKKTAKSKTGAGEKDAKKHPLGPEPIYFAF